MVDPTPFDQLPTDCIGPDRSLTRRLYELAGYARVERPRYLHALIRRRTTDDLVTHLLLLPSDMRDPIIESMQWFQEQQDVLAAERAEPNYDKRRDSLFSWIDALPSEWVLDFNRRIEVALQDSAPSSRLNKEAQQDAAPNPGDG